MIDILIPTYNRAHTIIETINSALNQTNVNVNVHIIDNNSTDNTVNLIKMSFSKMNIILIIYSFMNLMKQYLCIQIGIDV